MTAGKTYDSTFFFVLLLLPVFNVPREGLHKYPVIFSPIFPVANAREEAHQWTSMLLICPLGVGLCQESLRRRKLSLVVRTTSNDDRRRCRRLVRRRMWWMKKR